jgi:DNA phosphorothioation system restriction enzyme
MSLIDLDTKLRINYRTGRDDMVRDFFVPCLSESVLYRRAAGYFSSHGLSLAARGVAALIKKGGEMRLVVSPHLDPEDVEALREGIDRPEYLLRRVAARGMVDVEEALIRDRLNTLAWLAVTGHLKIRLALRLDAEGQIARGLFHEKSGIFTDSHGAHVAFTGSANETAGGLLENFESLEAFQSWHDPDGRVESKIADFEALWEDKTPGLKTLEFSEAGRTLLEAFRDPENPPDGLSLTQITENGKPVAFRPPAGFRLRDYQSEAIRAWSKAGGRGILAMATGTGKTLTALTLASKVAEKNQPLVLIVVCPFLNLCKQWLREMASFGLRPLPCYEGRDRWQFKFEEGYQRLNHGLSTVHAIVTTNKTFQSDAFQSYLKPHVVASRQHHLLIADEVHNLGAKAVSDALPDGIKLRIGLSATPERHLDPEGTNAVLSYFGNVIYEFGLQKAIAQGCLCRYRYHPQLVHLTDDEAAAYAEISAKLGPLLAGAEKNPEIGQTAMNLLIKRARLLAGADNKIHVLDKLLESLPKKPTKAIFYCGDGNTTDKISEEEVRQIHAVARLLGEKHGLRVRNFTFRESPAEREEILRDLASGFLDGVVAIRCLDEGIDLPDLRMGFLLASSTNPRQFVQRRGRLLRKAEGKTFAEIYDFVIAPPEPEADVDTATFSLERSLLRRELKRIEEFCVTAENGPEAQQALQDIRNSFNTLGNP